jgi:hypothetical protein
MSAVLTHATARLPQLMLLLLLQLLRRARVWLSMTNGCRR